MFSIGNSIGGYIVAPVPGSQSWGFWRIGGGLKNRIQNAPIDEAPQGVLVNGRQLRPSRRAMVQEVMTRNRPEKVVTPGREYLLATTSGSARNGITHAVRRGGDPVENALRELGISPRIIRRVEGPVTDITRFYDHMHCPNGRQQRRWVTDGKEIELEYTQLEKPSGHFLGGGQSRIELRDGTFAIAITGVGGGWKYRESISEVLLWGGYDPEKVIAAIRSVM